MMSLFSPFDMFWFFTPFMFVIFILIFTMTLVWKSSAVSLSLNWVSIVLTDFFLSLKPKYFTKASGLCFLSVFILLMVVNFSSVFPFNFPLTSQVSLVLSMGGAFWMGLIMFSVFKNTKGFFHHFIPEGAPLPLTVFLFLIEVVSSLIRPITLTVRLVANILAGHLLMVLLSSLVFFFNLASIFYIGLNLVEMCVAMIQAYIFTTMIVLYFSEV